MDTKKFVIILAVIAGLTVSAVSHSYFEYLKYKETAALGIKEAKDTVKGFFKKD